jgi:hypothetical protein
MHVLDKLSVALVVMAVVVCMPTSTSVLIGCLHGAIDEAFAHTHTL